MLAVDCGAVPVPANGFLKEPTCSTLAGSVCEVDCFEGHVLTGEVLFTCLNDSSWENAGIQCTGTILGKSGRTGRAGEMQMQREG